MERKAKKPKLDLSHVESIESDSEYIYEENLEYLALSQAIARDEEGVFHSQRGRKRFIFVSLSVLYR